MSVDYDMQWRLAEVRHGYTLHDLDQMTRAAVIADRSMASNIEDRKDIAWSAIAEHLCMSEEPPARQELIRIGWQAIYREARTAYRERGRPDEAWSGSENAPRPRFAQYWRDRQVAPSHEHRVVESIAVWQVLAPLTDTYRSAVVALATTDDYDKAAEMLDISYTAFKFRIQTARKSVLSLWHEGETPHLSRHRTDRRVGSRNAELATHCSNGHEWTPENTYTRNRIMRGKRHTSRVCKTCEHDRSVQRAQDKRERAEVPDAS
ncbi:hypothetical protein [Nonomuraea sp. NPDC049129]|uniref:hypothetical protein n=1 Tax=Nonomuraea sp. NPDC049129 TaxID=3155272 RepID=UPI0033DB66A2